LFPEVIQPCAYLKAPDEALPKLQLLLCDQAASGARGHNPRLRCVKLSFVEGRACERKQRISVLDSGRERAQEDNHGIRGTSYSGIAVVTVLAYACVLFGCEVMFSGPVRADL
jgi:hypothetical protein